MGAERNRYGWDHPLTAERYARFCAGPSRYRFANDALARFANLAAASRVLDFAAGLGHTAETVLAHAGAETRVLCVEPAAAMRSAGQDRLRDPRVHWSEALPTQGAFDRIVCGAALWQLDDLAADLRRLRALLERGGRLCFTIPSLYLGTPDRPGGGRDPQLVELFAELARGRTPEAASRPAPPGEAELVEILSDLGLVAGLEQLEYRLTQSELRDWLRIPVLTDALLSELDVEERDRLIETAFAASDPEAYRYEGWTVVSATAPG